MNIKQADEIVHEARMAGWPWVIRNAECYGLTPEQMIEFWRQHQQMTPRGRYPYGTEPPAACEMPAAEAISNGRKP